MLMQVLSRSESHTDARTPQQMRVLSEDEIQAVSGGATTTDLVITGYRGTTLGSWDYVVNPGGGILSGGNGGGSGGGASGSDHVASVNVHYDNPANRDQRNSRRRYTVS